MKAFLNDRNQIFLIYEVNNQVTTGKFDLSGLLLRFLNLNDEVLIEEMDENHDPSLNHKDLESVEFIMLLRGLMSSSSTDSKICIFLDEVVKPSGDGYYEPIYEDDQELFYCNEKYINRVENNNYDQMNARITEFRQKVLLIVEDWFVYKTFKYGISFKAISAFHTYSVGERREHYEISNIEELVLLAITKLWSTEIIISKCGYCGDFFIPKSRSDEVYCDKIHINGRSCKEMGYEKLLESDKGRKEYRKAYKRKHASFGKSEFEERKKMWQIWKDEAKTRLNEYIKGELKLDDFIEWLNK